MNYQEALNWRYAVKRMNGQKVPAEKIARILDAIHKAPTGMGLQPISVVVIEDEETRKRIAPLVYNQPQVTEGSALVVFTHWDDVTEAQVDAYLLNIAETRGISAGSLDSFRQSMLGFLNSKTQEGRQTWASRQAYIALGFGLVAAAMEQVDATPMEGFNPPALDEALGLPDKGLKSVALMALGYRDAEKDQLHGAPKVRRDQKEFFIHF